MSLHKVITIVSGARTPENNTGVSGSHHIPSNNPSGQGEAVDAYIGSKPLASVVKEGTLKKYGLYSGNRPGFYHGQPDPEHIETLERRGGKYAGGPPAAAPAKAPPADGSVTPPMPEPQVPGPPDPGGSIAPVLAPGTIQGEEDPKQLQETWQLLAADPLSSPETQAFAKRLQQGQL